MPFLAKSNGVTLEKHTADVLTSVQVLKRKNRSRYPEELWRDLEIAAFLHDTGKADPSFQRKVGGEYSDWLQEASPSISHNLVSLFLVNREKFIASTHSPEMVLGAVSFHHWRDYYPDLLLGSRSAEVSGLARNMSMERERWGALASKLRNEMRSLALQHGIDPEIIDLNANWVSYFQHSNLGNAGLLLPPYLLSFLPQRLTLRSTVEDVRKRIFLSGNLIRCDHFASLVETENPELTIEDIEYSLPLSYEELARVLEEIFREKSSDSQGAQSSFWQKEFFEKNPERCGQSMVFIAPTGVGKTEFSYLWGTGKKNIYLLPLKATVNAIWQRTQGVLGRIESNLRTHVALLHGEAALEFRNRKDELDLEGEGLVRSLVLARHLAEPYIIATGDQVAPAVLKYPGYERIYAVLMDSFVVIDEVQAYDPKAAAIVTKLLEDVHKLGGKVLLMTATLPPFIRREIEKRLELPVVDFLSETPLGKALATRSRHRLKIRVYRGESTQTEEICHAPSFEGLISEMTAAARDGRKVLAVFNTVKAAQRAYELASKLLNEAKTRLPLLLLHSLFTQADRRGHEKLATEDYIPNGKPSKIEGGCIVFATQIVEASLDIDADILYTELCPMDSLIQRLGRVWRRAARWVSGDWSPPYINVHILICTDNDKLCSGDGGVYDRHLLRLTAYLLACHAQGNQEITQLPSELLASYKEVLTPGKRSRRGAPRKGQNEEGGTKLLQFLVDAPEFSLTESEKSQMVNLIYEVLDRAEEEGESEIASYLSEYYGRLDALDNGYCSDRKDDAQRLFREIHTVEVVPSAMMKQFEEELETFIYNYKHPSYFDFAELILSRFTVPIAEYSMRRHKRQPLVDQIKLGEADSTLANKVRNWLQGIMSLSAPYDSDRGLVLEANVNGES
ncbi:MAG: CRISPR-associated helicase Cas3' [Firmicutes bacterium]|nr:CRISPR-associated helicase Cas3' [Bacillota bacterium]